MLPDNEILENKWIIKRIMLCSIWTVALAFNYFKWLRSKKNAGF